MNTFQYKESLMAMRSFFNSGETRSLQFRKAQLLRLKKMVHANEKQLMDALYHDLRKSAEESWVAEIGFFHTELNLAIRHLKSWAAPEKVSTNLLNFPSSSSILKEPLGVVLIIAPWNFPFQLLFTPLLSAVAAGNCVVLKPSEFSTATTKVMTDMLIEYFPENYLRMITGNGEEVVPALMNQFRFDHVFYTGSTGVGKIVYQMAAEKLIPVTLELGGKSPCIVEKDADINVAARRIALTKFSNAGQMCVAPDFVIVHQSVLEKLVQKLKEAIREFYTEDPSSSYNYGKIINHKQFLRLLGYLSTGTIIAGGRHDEASLYIEPTLLTNVTDESPLITGEIFGPLLPIVPFTKKEEVLEIVARNPHPLSFYVFTSDKEKEKYYIENVAFGGGCVNNASMQATNPALPFGGRGFSGIGAYHGETGFSVFTHRKAMMKTPTWFDPSIKYPPFKGKISLFKRFIGK